MSTAQPDVLPVRQTKEETKAFYNKIAKVYDLLAERTEQPIRDKSFQELAPKPEERILEIGFGTGHNLARIAKAVGPGGRAGRTVEEGQDVAQLAPLIVHTGGEADAPPVELRPGNGPQDLALPAPQPWVILVASARSGRDGG